MDEIRELNTEEINSLLLSGNGDGNYSPIGRFYHKDGDIYVGVDNSTGDAWTEDFTSLEDCLAWLQSGDGKHEQ